MTEVRLRACPDYEREHCRAALEAVCGGLSWVQPGMKIGVKVNLVAGAPPEKAVTTHPALVAALTELLLEHGASVVVGDSPGGLFTPAFLQRVYHLSGYEAVEQAGATLNTDCEIRETDFPQGAVLHRFSYTAWLDSCDALINFCKLKTHGMMGMTCAVKNLFGSIPGTMKPEYHFRFSRPEDFAKMLTDLPCYFRPRLHLVDAVTAMEGNGPGSGDPRRLGLVLGCEDPFALDEVCAGLIGCDAVPTQAAARELGRIPAYTVTGEDPAAFHIPDFVLPPRRGTLFQMLLPGKAGEALSRVLQSAMAPRPTLTPAKCVGCGKCAAICPAKAITMANHKPKFNRKTCIGCFCCQEFCPKGALEARRTPLARLLSPM